MFGPLDGAGSLGVLGGCEVAARSETFAEEPEETVIAAGWWGIRDRGDAWVDKLDLPRESAHAL